jgi:quercetin dioxygenase-like cupin family protein
MMIVKNIFQMQRVPVVAHGGEATIEFSRPFETHEFESSWRFVDYVVIPPGASIGPHRHGLDEEMYFVMEGTALMTTNDIEKRVIAGDLILNKPGWVHGLRNDGKENVKLLVIEVGLEPMSPAAER